MITRRRAFLGIMSIAALSCAGLASTPAMPRTLFHDGRIPRLSRAQRLSPAAPRISAASSGSRTQARSWKGTWSRQGPRPRLRSRQRSKTRQRPRHRPAACSASRPGAAPRLRTQARLRALLDTLSPGKKHLAEALELQQRAHPTGRTAAVGRRPFFLTLHSRPSKKEAAGSGA